VHWFVDSVGLYQGSPRGLILSDYSEDQEALIESAVINFKSRGVTSMVIAGDMLYKQAVSEVIRAKRGDDYYMIGRAGWTGLQEISGVLQGDPASGAGGLGSVVSDAACGARGLRYILPSVGLRGVF